MKRNKNIMRFLAAGFLAAALLAVGGCKFGKSVESDGGQYRTVSTPPLRDTDEARRLNDKGLAHLDRKELTDAEKAFVRALTADVEFGPAHNNLGKVHLINNKLHEAAWEFDHAIRLMPKHAAPHNNLGLVHMRAVELGAPWAQHDQAVERFREAVALEPGRIEYRANLAAAMFRRGDRTEEVRSLLKQVIDQDTRTEWVDWAKRKLLTVMSQPME